MTKLPVWATVRDAYAALRRHGWWLLHRSIVPLVLYVAFNLWAFESGYALISQSIGAWWRSFLFEACSFCLLVLLFAPALRRFLLDRNERPVTWPLPLSRSVLKLMQFLWPYPYSPALVQIAGLFVLVTLVRIGLSTIWSSVLTLGRIEHDLWHDLAALSGWVKVLMQTYVFVRLSLLPIDLILGRRAEFSAAWHATAGNGARLLAAMMLAQLPVYILLTLLYAAASPLHEMLLQSQPQQVLLHRLLLSGMIGLHWVLTLAVWAALTAAAFRRMAGSTAEEGVPIAAGGQEPV